jgi:transposase-like protein
MKQNPTKKRGRRKWSPEEKVEILRAHFAKGKLVDTCEEHRIHPNVLANWWKTTIEAAVPALSGAGRKQDRAQERSRQRLESELDQKNRVIAELAAEVLDLKKPFGET